MNNLKISTRLTLIVGFLSALLLVIGGVGLYGMARTNAGLQTVYEDRTVPMGHLAQIERLLLRDRQAIAHALAVADAAQRVKNLDEIDRNNAAIERLWSAYMASELTPQEAQLARAFEQDHKKFIEEGLMPAIAALRSSDTATATEVFGARLELLFGPVENDVEALVKLQLEVAKSEFARAQALLGNLRVVIIAVVVGGIALALVLGLSLVRGILRSLNHAVAVADAVAAGDLTRSIETEGRDEIADLLHSMAAMKESLIRVVSSVRQNADAVATGSAQIAQGSQDLSQRTEQQASALQETAASMEQLGSTVKQNADNARQANQLALGASSVAVKGGEVVGEVVNTMRDINDSSRKIADIIGVIDGIAFQTNILALNAAVEAARAGEQGRGFAVVASEVRSLAQRCADAAKQIKALISASVERVEQGTTLVDQAGATMAEIVESIKRVADIMGEISAAAAEQSSGVAQVAEAIGQMDQVTQQNAALVEQSAAAAESLMQQAQQLVQAVAVFKLDHGASLGYTPAPEVHPSRALPAAERRAQASPKRVAQLSTGTGKAQAAQQAPATPAGDDDWTTF